eukprot:scaffold152044_cov30-Prasinocladus_malaysianus.AAC.1
MSCAEPCRACWGWKGAFWSTGRYPACACGAQKPGWGGWNSSSSTAANWSSSLSPNEDLCGTRPEGNAAGAADAGALNMT